MSFEQLENKGFSFLNLDKLSPEKRQIVVVGSARGGTSLIAGALHHLGIFTGDKSNAPVFEDLLLSNAFESKNPEQIVSIIKDYDKRYDIWAWKRPGALNYLNSVEEYIKNPFYIFIFKDIFSIANRNNISMQADIAMGLRNALEDYEKIVDFVQITEKPVMLVSAEKALQNKGLLIDALIELNKDFLRAPDRKSAVDFITPNPKQYLDLTRNTKVIGNVGKVEEGVVYGWAQYLHSNEKVDLEVSISGKAVGIFEANQYRGHKANDGDVRSFCGFSIPIGGYKKPFLLEIKPVKDISIIKGGSIEFN